MAFREDVCIVLNEREALKEKLAEALLEQLKVRSISAERLEVSADLSSILLERKPRILVLDYILGDVGTGLDVLSDLSHFIENQETRPLIWTDEPSVNVAVSAMKLGAKDYLDISSPNTLGKMVHKIEEELSSIRSLEQDSRKPKQEYSQLVSYSKSYEACLELARSAALSQRPIVVIYGPKGSGRSSLARFIHEKRGSLGAFRELNLDTWSGDVHSLYGSNRGLERVPLLAFGASVFIDHAEFETEELLSCIEKQSKKIWSNTKEESAPMLIVGTSSIEIAKLWAEAFSLTPIEIPPLSDRKTDFLPLVKYFLKSTKLLKKHSDSFSPELINVLTQLSWPGNVSEFRAAVYECCAILENEKLAKNQETEIEIDVDQDLLKFLDSGQLLLLSTVLEAKKRWLKYHESQPYVPEVLAAKQSLDLAAGNVRIAAVQLGTGVRQLKEALGLVHSEEAR